MTLITDANGDEQRRYDYDAYGEGRAVEGYPYAYLNPFRYSGEYFDEETGFYYLRARYYDPSIGRFLTEDPAGDGTNSDRGRGGKRPPRIEQGMKALQNFAFHGWI